MVFNYDYLNLVAPIFDRDFPEPISVFATYIFNKYTHIFQEYVISPPTYKSKLHNEKASGYCYLKALTGKRSLLATILGPNPTLADFVKTAQFYNVLSLGFGLKITSNPTTRTFHLSSVPILDNSEPMYWRTLALCYGDWRIGMLEPQTVVDIAQGATAASMGGPTAASDFQNALKSISSVEIYLTPDQKKTLEDMLGFKPRYLGTKSNIGDHPIIAAYREIIRDAFEKLFHISSLKGTKLFVGAAAREIFRERKNENSFFYIHGSEGKDTSRIVCPLIEELLTIYEQAIKSCSKTMKRYKNKRDAYKKTKEANNLEEIRQHFNDLTSLLKGIELNSNYAGRFLREIEGVYNYLILEDSAYNYNEQDWYRLFEHTNAEVAYAYGLYPLEMLFPEMQQNKLYYYDEGRYDASLTYYAGYSNGYTHNKKSWKLPMEKMAIQGPNFNLNFEHVARSGPMLVFKVERTQAAIKGKRTISLPDRLRTVKVLDFERSIDISTGKFKTLKYLYVRKEEFDTAANYFDSLAESAKVYETLLNFIRKRKGGAALLNKQLLEEWSLRDDDLNSFAISVFLYALARKVSLVNNFDILTKTLFERSVFTLKCYFAGFFEGLTDLITSLDFIKKIKAETIYKIDQEVDIPAADLMSKRIYVDAWFSDEDLGSDAICPICDKLDANPGVLNGQVVICNHKSSFVDFVWTDDLRTKFDAELLNTQNDHEDLKKVKDRARAKMPKTKFVHRCQVMHIRGGPGVGKSRLIRFLADKLSLVAAPFTKLAADYQKTETQKKEIIFKTNHRTIDVLGINVMFVDEFTAMDWRYIANCAYLNKVNTIFLVGDVLQTCIQKEHGIYCGDMIDLSSLSEHTLLINYRNPVDVIATLNNKLDYDLQVFEGNDNYPSKVHRSIYWGNWEDWNNGYIDYNNPDIEKVERIKIPEISKIQKLFFSNNCIKEVTGKDNTGEDKITVTANQGADEECCVLFVSRFDGALSKDKRQVRVALSRHKKILFVISIDDSAVAKDFSDSYNLSHLKLADLKKLATASPFQTEKPELVKTFKRTDDQFIPVYRNEESLVGTFSLLYNSFKRRNDIPQTENPIDVGEVDKYSNFIEWKCNAYKILYSYARPKVDNAVGHCYKYIVKNKYKFILMTFYMLIKNKYIRKILGFLLKTVFGTILYAIINVLKFLIFNDLTFINPDWFLDTLFKYGVQNHFNQFMSGAADLSVENILLKKGSTLCAESGLSIEELLDQFAMESDLIREDYPLDYNFLNGFCWLNIAHPDEWFKLAYENYPFMTVLQLLPVLLKSKQSEHSFNYVYGHIRPFFSYEPMFYKIIRLILPQYVIYKVYMKIIKLFGVKSKVVNLAIYLAIKMLLGAIIDKFTMDITNFTLNCISKLLFSTLCPIFSSFLYYYQITSYGYRFLNMLGITSQTGFVRHIGSLVGPIMTDRTFIRSIRFIFDHVPDMVRDLTKLV